MQNANLFLGHTSDVENGFKKPLLQLKKEKTLVNSESFFLANNICPHQGSLIIPQTAKHFACQYHGWSWSEQGLPISSGTTKICNESKLSLIPVYVTNNLLFRNAINIPELSKIDLASMKLIEERIDIVKCTYQNIIDVFLDVDHIPVVHKGVYDQIGITGIPDVRWSYYDWGNVQTVKNNTNNQTIAMWIAIYPYTMIEWQMGAMFVTVCIPKHETTDVAVFKYQDLQHSNLWSMNSDMWETAWSQDKTQSENIVRRLNSNLEESKEHFRSWLEDKE